MATWPVTQCEARRYGASEWSAPHVIPSRMMGTHLDEEIHETLARVGTDARELRLAIDFSGSRLIVSNAPAQTSAGDTGGSDPADWSSTYATSGGGSDLVRFSGRRYRMPVSFDPSAAAAFGCPTCNGVLGVGPGSPLWLLWRHATFSAGTVTLGRRHPPVSDRGAPRVACAPLRDELCVARAQAFGHYYNVSFDFRSLYTVVPPAVYDQYVGTRSVGETPADEWPSLVLRFDAADAPVDTRRPKLRIAPRSLVGDSRHGHARNLMLRRSTDPTSDEIVLGRTVWRSLMLHRDFTTGHVAITSYDSTKRFPTWSLVLGAILILVLCRWWMTRDALFYEAVAGRFAGTRVAAIAYRFRNQVLLSSSLLASSALASSSSSRRFLPIGAYMPWEDDDGSSSSPSQSPPDGPFGSWRFPGEWGVYPDRLIIELATVPAAIASLYIPALREPIESRVEFWGFLQGAVYASVAWLVIIWAARLAGRADAFGVLRYRIAGNGGKQGPGGGRSRSFVVFRAGLIRQAALDVLLSVAGVMLAGLTRTDTLGTTILALTCGILSGVVLYHTVAAVIHATYFEYRFAPGQGGGRHGRSGGQGLWFLWILYGLLLTLATAAFVSVFVLVPFMQLHVTSANGGDYLLVAAVVYLLGFYVAFELASFEAVRMEDWIERQRATAAITPLPAPRK